MNDFKTITYALFGAEDLDQAIATAKQRQQKRQQILARQSAMPRLQLTLKQRLIATWVARGLDPVTAAHKADRVIERQTKKRNAQPN